MWGIAALGPHTIHMDTHVKKSGVGGTIFVTGTSWASPATTKESDED